MNDITWLLTTPRQILVPGVLGVRHIRLHGLLIFGVPLWNWHRGRGAVRVTASAIARAQRPREVSSVEFTQSLSITNHLKSALCTWCCKTNVNFGPDLYKVGSGEVDMTLIKNGMRVTFTFTFRAFGRRLYPKRLTKSTFVEGEAAIYHCGTWR